VSEHIFYQELGTACPVRNPAYGRGAPASRFRRKSRVQASYARDNFGGLRVETALVRDVDYYKGPIITSAEEVYLLIRRSGAQNLCGDPDERFLVVLLDTRHRAVGIYEAAHGTSSSVEVHPRNVFRAAIVANAKAVILVHNHPSGDAEPSHEDAALTRRMQEAGRILGIEVLDHIVIADNYYTSLAERGSL